MSDDKRPKGGGRVITVRMPRSLHKAIKRAADDRLMSLNAFCIDAIRTELAATIDPLGREGTLAEVCDREQTEGDDR